eukprot:scaffold351_cov123-Skeletonema_dohrnii-CCMP3373.AAC.1
MNRPNIHPYSFRVAKLFATYLVLFAVTDVSCLAGSEGNLLPESMTNDKIHQQQHLVRELAENKQENNNVKQIDKEEDDEEQATANPTPKPTVSLSPSATPSSAPTANPSASPSSAPSAEPSPSPSSSPTLSSAPSSAPIPYSRPPRVDIRYVPWIDLPADIATTATLLNYTYETWNDYGANSIENLNWDRLSRNEKMYAAILGYQRESWDCWQNHYQSLRWIDLDNEGIQSKQWWEALGWDISSWNKYDDPPASNDKYWYLLSEEERFAAAQLCYFKRTWDEAEVYVDGFPLEKPEYRYTNWFDLDGSVRRIASDGLKYDDFLWNVVGLHSSLEARDWKQLTAVEQKAARLLEFSQTSWDCWINNYRGYSLGWNDQSWAGLEEAPDKKSWKQLNVEERRAAIELCYSFETWEGYDMTINYGPFPFAKPKRRYVEWADLPEEIQIIANGTLEYTEEKWNNLGSAKIETLGWDELTDEQQSDAIDLGFYKKTWDCFHSHYRSYDWNDLSTSQQDIFRLLGWSEAKWPNNETPSSYVKQWDQLSTTEQSVANAVCYFEHNWDRSNLKEEEIDVVPSGSNPTQGFDASDISDVLNGRKNSANTSKRFTTSFIALSAVACIACM